MSRAVITGALVAALAGCADELPAGSRLERTRLLAVVAAPSADPTRAWPRAGEEAEVALVLDGPGALPAMAWHVDVCVADASGEACAAAPFASVDGEGAPRTTFVAPDGVAALVVRGRVEPAGEAETSFDFFLPVEQAAPNHHPRLRELAVPGDCVRAGGDDIELRVVTAAADREPYTRADGTSAREGLRLSFFATDGELARQFAVVAPDDPRELAEVVMPWTPPPAEDVPEDGLEVRFVVVARDLRGGVDVRRATVCVRR